ncbi:MAG: hypothetical protein AAGI52_10790 [Bacteroidota bacterium]
MTFRLTLAAFAFALAPAVGSLSSSASMASDTGLRVVSETEVMDDKKCIRVLGQKVCYPAAR